MAPGGVRGGVPLDRPNRFQNTYMLGMKMNQTSINATTDWPRVFLVLGAGVIAACQIGKAPPCLPLLRTDLHLTLVAAGWVVSIFNFLTMAGGVVAGAMADRFGHRRFILGGLIVLGLGSLGGGLAPNQTAMLASRLLEGLGFLVLGVAAPALMIRCSSPRHVRIVLSFWSCWVPAGTALMMLLAPAALKWSNWRALWLVNALLLVTYAGLFHFRMGKGTRPEKTSGGPVLKVLRDVKQIVSRPGPVLLGLCFGAYALQYGSFTGFLPTLLMEDFGAGAATASLLSAGMVAMNIPGNLLAGFLLQRGVSRVSLLTAAFVVMGLCALGIYTRMFPDTVRVGLGFLFTGWSGMIPGALFAGTVVHAPRPSLAAATNGIMMQGSNLGITLGAPVMAMAVTSAGGWHGGIWVMAAASAAGLALSLGLGRLEKARPGPGHQPG